MPGYRVSFLVGLCLPPFQPFRRCFSMHSPSFCGFCNESEWQTQICNFRWWLLLLFVVVVDGGVGDVGVGVGGDGWKIFLQDCMGRDLINAVAARWSDVKCQRLHRKFNMVELQKQQSVTVTTVAHLHWLQWPASLPTHIYVIRPQWDNAFHMIEKRCQCYINTDLKRPKEIFFIRSHILEVSGYS